MGWFDWLASLWGGEDTFSKRLGSLETEAGRSISALPSETVTRRISGGSRKVVFSFLLLDASSSMKSLGDTPRRELNRHLQALRGDKANDHFVMVMVFDQNVRVLVPFSHIDEVDDVESYNCGRGTRLFQTADDLLGAVVEVLWEKLDRRQRQAARVVVAVITDGLDGLSDKKTQPASVRRLAKECRKRWRWDLFVIAIRENWATQIDGKEIARQMGFDPSASKTVVKNEEGMVGSMEMVTCRTIGVR